MSFIVLVYTPLSNTHHVPQTHYLIYNFCMHFIITCSIVSLCIPRTQTADPLDRKQTIDPLDQWDCVLEWNCRASTGLHPSKLTGALTGHCVGRRRRTCKEWNEIREGMWYQSWLFTSSSQSLVQLSIVGAKPWVRLVINHVGVTNVAKQHKQEKPSSIVSLCILGMRTDPVDQWDWE
jgi:hypothetical protein